jgi:hypothetical protein
MDADGNLTADLSVWCACSRLQHKVRIFIVNNLLIEV